MYLLSSIKKNQQHSNIITISAHAINPILYFYSDFTRDMVSRASQDTVLLYKMICDFMTVE